MRRCTMDSHQDKKDEKDEKQEDKDEVKKSPPTKAAVPPPAPPPVVEIDTMAKPPLAAPASVRESEEREWTKKYEEREAAAGYTQLVRKRAGGYKKEAPQRPGTSGQNKRKEISHSPELFGSPDKKQKKSSDSDESKAEVKPRKPGSGFHRD